MMNKIEERFFQCFTEPGSDRHGLLWDFLSDSNLSPQSITMAEAHHILIGPHRNSSGKTPQRVLVAHYDCVPGSPGANDNGAAVLQLIGAAKLLQTEGVANWYILFTDKEERCRGSAINSQGSYLLAQAFKTIGLGTAHFYIFDACGRGNTLILSTALDQLSKKAMSETMTRKINQTRSLRGYALERARSLMIRRIQLLPTPFSDDLGFLSAGLTAQTITILPENETELLSNRTFRSLNSITTPTWQLLNSPQDRRDTLTEEGFAIIPDFAFALCAGRPRS